MKLISVNIGTLTFRMEFALTAMKRIILKSKRIAKKNKLPCRILAQEPLTWIVSSDIETSLYEPIQLVLLPSPCNFRKLATESLKKANRKCEVLFTGTSTASIQAAVQAGMGLTILPQGAITKGVRKAPSNWELPELPMYSLTLFTDEKTENDARDIFIFYLKAELNNLK